VEDQIANLSDIEVTLTDLMMVLAVPISFAIQFIKALADKVEFFKAEEIRKSLFPMISIALTIGAYYIAGVQDFVIAGVVMGLAASGGYQAFSGSAKLIKPVATTAGVLLLCAILIFGCETFKSDPKAELLASQKTFSATVDSLTILQVAGKFSTEETEQLTVLIHQGQDYLIEWEGALKAGSTRPDAISLFQAVLDQLLEYELAKGGD